LIFDLNFMFLLSALRVIKFSLQDIARNIWLSIVTITILILALFSINMLLTVQIISDTAISAVKEKIDVSMYLNPEASEEEILALKIKIENMEEVREVKYTSRAQALEDFREKNDNNPEVLQALKELGKNPLSPSLVIKPNEVNNSDEFINKLNQIDNKIIESRNFADHKLLLSKINAITDKVNNAGMIVSIIFVLITLLVVYNAVKVAIYTHKKEIAIMKLVGASNSFVYMPFLLSGVFFALLGVLVIIVVFYPFLTLLQPYLEAFFIGYNVNIVSYYNENFFYIFGLQFVGAALINILAAFFAVKKYTKV